MTKRIYLCQPYSYSIEPEAMEARERAIDGWGGLEIVAQRICSTMLCDAFNCGVANCKNGKFDYFAMLHSDHGPAAGWLGDLLNELEESGADIINAASLIKDSRYLTSATVAYSSDPHQMKRRLSLREVFTLPETFTIDDVRRTIDPDASILLPNPGCMAMRTGQWFADWPGFNTFSDVRLDEHGEFKPHSISEDYMFGYWAAEHGLKVTCTRKVITHHFGRCDFNTAEPRGMDTDRFYMQTIGQPPVGEGKWVFPLEVDGWLTSAEGVALAKLAMGRRVLEIGSYSGRSTLCMSQTARHVVSVDPHDGRATDKPQNTLPMLMANLGRYQQKNVTVYQTTSEAFAADCGGYGGKQFDLVFIDGDHSLEAVKADIAVAMQVLAPDGLIAFHDYRTLVGEHDGRWNPGVTQAVDELIAAGAELIDRQGTVAVVKPVLVEVA